MTLIKTFALAAALGVALTSQSMAALLVDNGSPDLVSGTQMSATRVAENFTLASASDISSIRFWSVQSAASDYTGSVNWAIFSSTGSAPDAVLFGANAVVAGVATGTGTGFGYDAYEFNISMAASLAAGDYWLSLYTGPLNAVDPPEMLWATTASGTGPSGLYLDGGTWVSSGNEHAFMLNGETTVSAIPEPENVLLMLAGLMTIQGMRLRKRTKK
jgi:hypothetical protein